MILHMHRAGHGTDTRQKNHGISFRVAVGKLEGDPLTVQGHYNVCREMVNEVDLPRGLFAQDWGN